jgi:hypothetical protein
LVSVLFSTLLAGNAFTFIAWLLGGSIENQPTAKEREAKHHQRDA